MKYQLPQTPFVSICTPTYNRRPFIPMMLQCFEHQNYPKDMIEWIIIDDGTDKIEDLVSHIPQVRYVKIEEKLTLGKKRNMGNDMAKGDVIIYMDDDDYYPPERIKHAVYTLRKNPKALCVGSSTMYIYFNHLQKMYQCGPYGEKHATAATFAFRKELLKETRFDESASVAEERNFLKAYTVPFAQLDPLKSILVFSHKHNSFNKKELLAGLIHPEDKRKIRESELTPEDFVKEPDILRFFMKDIDDALDYYQIGTPLYKPDVTRDLINIKQQREEVMIKMKKAEEEEKEKYQTILSYTSQIKKKTNDVDNQIQELQNQIKELTESNNNLRKLNTALLDKVKSLTHK
jgi:glycosyltransferase involved in cell wall biosynthesis